MFFRVLVYIWDGKGKMIFSGGLKVLEEFRGGRSVFLYGLGF